MADRDGGPAFPVVGAPGAPEDYPGMSLRDWFAGQALAGMVGVKFEQAPSEWTRQNPDKFVARACYLYADAMLAERERRPAGDGAESGADREPPPVA